MNNLEIQLDSNKMAFVPGEEIRGIAKWQLDYEPGSMELSLFWHTEGRGIQDTGIAETIVFENAGAFGQKDFKFIAPAGPYSFSGKLVSIIWALEFATAKGKDVCRKDITISPTGQKIEAGESIPDSDEAAAKNFLGKWSFQIKQDS